MEIQACKLDVSLVPYPPGQLSGPYDKTPFIDSGALIESKDGRTITYDPMTALVTVEQDERADADPMRPRCVWLIPLTQVRWMVPKV